MVLGDRAGEEASPSSPVCRSGPASPKPRGDGVADRDDLDMAPPREPQGSQWRSWPRSGVGSPVMSTWPVRVARSSVRRASTDHARPSLGSLRCGTGRVVCAHAGHLRPGAGLCVVVMPGKATSHRADRTPRARPVGCVPKFSRRGVRSATPVGAFRGEGGGEPWGGATADVLTKGLEVPGVARRRASVDDSDQLALWSVQVSRCVTESSFDTYLWQTVEGEVHQPACAAGWSCCPQAGPAQLLSTGSGVPGALCSPVLFHWVAGSSLLPTSLERTTRDGCSHHCSFW